MNKLEEAVSIH